MSNEITYHSAADTGLTVYAVLENMVGQLWNGSAFEAPISGNWDDYDIALTEQATSTGIFHGNMPGAAAGAYSYVIRLRAGGSPAVDDLVLASSGIFTWDGSVITTAAVLLLAARAEPGQGTPSVNPSPLSKIDHLYKNWRNRKVQDENTWELYADDATTVDQKATVSDDGTDAEKGKIVSGP